MVPQLAPEAGQQLAPEVVQRSVPEVVQQSAGQRVVAVPPDVVLAAAPVMSPM